MRKYEDTTVAMMDENKRVAPTVQVMFDLSQRKPIDGSSPGQLQSEIGPRIAALAVSIRLVIAPVFSHRYRRR